MNTLVIVITDSEHSEKYEPIEGFTFQYVTVKDWNNQLSPWPADPVFGKQRFGGHADSFLTQLLESIDFKSYDRYWIAGYSLAGLFALYACTKTNLFNSCVCASGSMWYKDFISYLKENPVHTKHVYMSLGNQEAKSKHPVLKTVQTCTEEIANLLAQYTDVTYELREGGHFSDEKVWITKGLNCLISKQY